MPCTLLKEELDVIDLFYNNFTNKNARKSLSSNKTRFHILYWFLSESYSELSENGKQTGSYLDFNILKRKFVIIDDKVMFACMVVLKRRLAARFDLKTAHYPKWLIKETYWAFKEAYERLISKEVFGRCIFNGRPNGAKPIKNQKEAFALVTGSMNKEAVEKIISTIFKLNAGPRNSKFKNYSSVVRLANRLYDECKYIFYSNNSALLGSSKLDEKWKKTRMTKKKCLKYILYWGAMSTLQQHHGRSLEVNAKKELHFFSHAYSLLRMGLAKMKLLKCTDILYCPGVRSRSWETKVMLSVGQKVAPYKFSLNNIEKEYSKVIKYKDKEVYAEKKSMYAVRYLPDKLEAYENYEKFKTAGRNCGSQKFMAFKLHIDNPRMKQRCLDQADLFAAQKRDGMNVMAKFWLKYSADDVYEWMYEGKGMYAIG